MTQIICTKPESMNHLSGYRTFGCRCPLCKEANRVAVQNWRWRTGRVRRKLVPVRTGDGEVKKPKPRKKAR